MDQQDKQNLAVAAVVVAILVAAVWLMTEMKRHGQVEDCLMARRRNCDQLLQR